MHASKFSTSQVRRNLEFFQLPASLFIVLKLGRVFRTAQTTPPPTQKKKPVRNANILQECLKIFIFSTLNLFYTKLSMSFYLFYGPNLVGFDFNPVYLLYFVARSFHFVTYDKALVNGMRIGVSWP